MPDLPPLPHWPDCPVVEVCYQIHEVVYERYRRDPTRENRRAWVAALQAVSGAIRDWRRRQDAPPWPQAPPDK
ncbi:hypothetical protein IGS68_31625 (plasmid) [Skermanella sp. TT6]|uniref:PH domain-containing protein n=1 Tax=Skermanella cutis TaxID=2775420 RepID=A0ABX7BGU3_9PROT|nr:hypothetical protein [Skermanella sp. TT6]QQP93577.1 hypothetical protein IGS68_31625 [Skermanella sp. TT6]